ncbi:MAG: ExbD/TolR family protein [Planctomycetota bacterium]
MFTSVQRRGNGAAGAPQVNLAPLMDLVFILLIFFLVTATFVRDTGITVERPRAAWSDSLDARSLRVGIAAGGAVYVEGQRTDLGALRERIARFVTDERDGSVVLIPDRKTPSGRLVEVMDTAKLAGARELAVATRRKERR